MANKKFTSLDDNYIKKRIFDGVTIKAIAEELGVGYSRLNHHILKLRANGYLPEKRH